MSTQKGYPFRIYTLYRLAAAFPETDAVGCGKLGFEGAYRKVTRLVNGGKTGMFVPQMEASNVQSKGHN